MTGLALGVLADQLIGDPRRGHPVALYGHAVSRVERVLYRDSRAAGAVFAAVCIAAPVVLGRVLPRSATAVVTWAVLGGKSLAGEGRAVQALLDADELPGARQRLTHLVGRDTAELNAAAVSRAVVESLAENTCDAVVAPLFWGAVAGLPGLLGYRAVNTLDAMVGHRSPRYRNFGWAAARLDDLANLVPARLTMLLTAATAPLVGGSPGAAVAVARRDARHHPSPNSGWGEAAFAGALGLRLGGRNVYAGRVEQRAVLGDGRPPRASDIERAARLLRAVTIAFALLIGRKR